MKKQIFLALFPILAFCTTLQDGDRAWELGDTTSAIQIYSKVIEKQQKPIRALWRRGMLFALSGNEEAANSDLQALAQIDPAFTRLMFYVELFDNPNNRQAIIEHASRKFVDYFFTTFEQELLCDPCRYVDLAACKDKCLSTADYSIESVEHLPRIYRFIAILSIEGLRRSCISCCEKGKKIDKIIDKLTRYSQ